MRKEKRTLVVGEKINRLTVISLHHRDDRHRKYYLFKCECGNKKIIHGASIVSGNTKSCSCLLLEKGKNRRISKNHSEITAIILGYKRHAERRGFEWLLNRKFIEQLIKNNCFYCGSKPFNIKKTKNSIGKGLLYSGIDRIDSVKGYTEGNVVPCCRICNYAKSDLNIVEFKKWALKIGRKAMANQWGRND